MKIFFSLALVVFEFTWSVVLGESKYYPLLKLVFSLELHCPGKDICDYHMKQFFLDCGNGFAYTPKNLYGSTIEWSYGEGIDNCRTACQMRNGCAGFEYNHGGEEGYKCGTYDASGSATVLWGSIKENEDQSTSWISCVMTNSIYG